MRKSEEDFYEDDGWKREAFEVVGLTYTLENASKLLDAINNKARGDFVANVADIAYLVQDMAADLASVSDILIGAADLK